MTAMIEQIKEFAKQGWELGECKRAAENILKLRSCAKHANCMQCATG